MMNCTGKQTNKFLAILACLAPAIRGRLATKFVDLFIYGNISIEGMYDET